MSGEQTYESIDTRSVDLLTRDRFVVDRDWAAATLSPTTKQIGLFTVEHGRAMFVVWVVEDQNGSNTVQRFFTGEGAHIATSVYTTPSTSGLWSDGRGSLLHCGAPEAHDEALLQGRSRIVISRLLPKRDDARKHDLIELFNRTSTPLRSTSPEGGTGEGSGACSAA